MVLADKRKEIVFLKKIIIIITERSGDVIPTLRAFWLSLT